MISLTTIKREWWKLSLTIFFFIFFAITFANANETVTLQLKWKHQFQFAGYYAAIEQGYYLEEGLEVILVEGEPGGKEVEEQILGWECLTFFFQNFKANQLY